MTGAAELRRGPPICTQGWFLDKTSTWCDLCSFLPWPQLTPARGGGCTPAFSVSSIPPSTAIPRGQPDHYCFSLPALIKASSASLPAFRQAATTHHHRELILSSSPPMPVSLTPCSPTRPGHEAVPERGLLPVVATQRPEEPIILICHWPVHSSPCLSAVPASANPSKRKESW